MGVIREAIETIEIYSPPLKRHRYTMSGLGSQVRTSHSGATGLLYDEIVRRDKIASGLLEKSNADAQQKAAEKGSYDTAPDEMKELLDPNEQQNSSTDSDEAPAPKKKFRVIRRVEDLIFDDTAEQIGKLEDEAYELLNEDGYYDEILPYDADIEYEEEGGGSTVKRFIILTVVLFALIGLAVWYIKAFF